MRGLLLIGAVLLGLAACTRPSSRVDRSGVYTLYRDSALDFGTPSRLRVATFDAADGDAYNRENCAAAGRVFQGRPNAMVRYWCEKGSARF